MPAEGGSPEIASLRFLAGLAGGGRLALLVVLMLVSSATEGLGLLMLVPITQLVAGGPPEGLDTGWLAALSRLPLVWLLAGFVALVAVKAIFAYRVNVMRSALGELLTRRLRVTVHGAIVAARWRWLSAERGADHAAMIMGMADRAGNHAAQALQLAVGGTTLAVLVASALYLSPALTGLCVAFGVAAAWGRSRWRARASEDAEACGDAYVALERQVANGLSHLRAARIAGAQPALLDNFAQAARELERAELRYFRATAASQCFIQIVSALILALIVWVSLNVLALPLALLVPAIAIFARIVGVAGGIHHGLRAWRFCRPAIASLRNLAAAASAHAEPSVPEMPPLPFRRTIALEGVSVRFPGRSRPVFHDFSRTVPAGGVIAVAGPSGSGKSTLADLICGLTEPDEGTVSVDGHPLDAEGRIRWRRQVAYVEQTPYLFHGTIAQNVAWGAEGASAERISAALRLASADFVARLPDGADTLVGEAGRQLSGGERQRIALARALLREPALIVLDEVTAALDSANEAAIARTIARLRGKCTFLILGHREALLALADEVIQLDGYADGMR